MPKPHISIHSPLPQSAKTAFCPDRQPPEMCIRDRMTSIHELLQKEAQAVLNIPITDAYEKAVELIVEQIHRKKGKLVTTGMGKAGQLSLIHI